jgi:hypothetical protein
MKITIYSLLILSLLLIPVKSAYAESPNDMFTICHRSQNESGYYYFTLNVPRWDLQTHLDAGDTMGACVQGAPSVPEFGAIPGIVAAITSGGAFLLLKKRASNR